jgi:membrane-associated protease RseP (regulator of RpoE activity)
MNAGPLRMIGPSEAPTLEEDCTSRRQGKGALRQGRALVVCAGVMAMWLVGAFSVPPPGWTADNGAADGMTVDEAAKLGEDFGVVVGEVDEEIQKELKLQRPQGVAVFEVIGNSRADYAGIKVRSVIKEIDKKEVKNMLDFGRHIKKAMNECNFTVGTYEPADPGDPVGWGVNFHFVGCKRD